MSKKGTVNPTLFLLLLVIVCPFLGAFATIYLRLAEPLRTLTWIVAVIFPVIVLTGVSPRLVRSKRLSRLREREILPFDDFYATFYFGSGLDKNSVVAALKSVSETLGLPAGLLRPTDRFDKELRPPAGYEACEGITHLDSGLDRMWRSRRSPTGVLDRKPIVTLGDYITVYCELLRLPEKKKGRRLRSRKAQGT
jgi:hypothetical protein